MDLKKIKEILEEEPAYRLKQVKKLLFQDLIGNWEEATTLSKELRQKLSKDCPISELKAEKVLTSDNNSAVKVLFVLKDGLKIESVLMKHEDNRKTVCVSSQVGCAMGCTFCATSQQGFRRNLTVDEIVEQVMFFARTSKKERISNVVFMGMGEPFLNYDNVLEAIRVLNDKDGLNIGIRHISISTAGITEGINKLADENLQINLAVSLHAPNNDLRLKLMPINKKYPIEEIITAVKGYIKKTKRRVMFEYLMIDGVNDSPAQAEELSKLLKKILCFVNLISFNPVGHSKFKSSSGWKIKKFKEVLEKNNISVTQRYRFGQEIKAACGQLAGENL
ncbi:MAG: 23S rRNA (adenine(2503)-C(2))-methyltransferase RlmN [Candidatus Paceibacterota bacterium]